jgi:hypothetical protein
MSSRTGLRIFIRDIMALINRHQKTWLNDLREQVDQALALSADNHVFAFIDGAFYPSCYDRLKARRDRLNWHSLFAALPGADEETRALSPILLQLSPTDSSVWQSILRLTDGWPMLSWIVTPESLEQLVARLTPWCVIDADGQSLILRFADTRRLPDIVTNLTAEQHGQLFGPVTCWRYVTRAAQWAQLPQPSRALPPTDTIKLNARQCAVLIGSSEPDEIIASLYRTDRNLIDCITPDLGYETIRHALNRADHYRIEQPHDREDFCALMLQFPDLESNTIINQLLTQCREQKAKFEEVLPTLYSALH